MNLDSLMRGYVEERVNEAKAKLMACGIFCSALEDVYKQNKAIAEQLYTVSMYQMLMNPEWSESDLIEWFVSNIEL